MDKQKTLPNYKLSLPTNCNQNVIPSPRDINSSSRMRANKHKNIFDIDFNTFLKIKRQFPENQVSINDRVIGKKKVKYGMPVSELIHILAQYVDLNEAKQHEVRMHIDRLDP